MVNRDYSDPRRECPEEQERLETTSYEVTPSSRTRSNVFNCGAYRDLVKELRKE